MAFTVYFIQFPYTFGHPTLVNSLTIGSWTQILRIFDDCVKTLSSVYIFFCNYYLQLKMIFKILNSFNLY